MSKRVYISADYSEYSGDRDVVDMLNSWGTDYKHKTDFIDMAKVVSGSVTKNNDDCRPCDIKEEFNRQINASSAVIFVVGDKTKTRTAGSECERASKERFYCECTPYKQNSKGKKLCKLYSKYSYLFTNEDVNQVNSYSYLRHEFEQAKKKNRKIIVVYNSTRHESNWLPSYLKGYEFVAEPFWVTNYWGEKVGNYSFIKRELGYD